MLIDAVGHFFLDVVAGRQAFAGHGRGVAPPHVEEIGGAIGAARAPENEQRRRGLAILVRGVHLEIAGRAGAIVAARPRDGLQRVDADIFVEGGGRDEIDAGAAADQHAVAQEELRARRADQAFGERLGLRHEQPVPGRHRPRLRRVGPDIVVRQHIHDGRLDQPLRMIEAHAVRRAPAAVVAGDEISPVAELLHHLDHVLRHGAETVVDVVGAGLGQRAVAIAAQIGQHDVIALREPRRDLVPAHVALGIAVQQKQRRARSAMTHADRRAARLHVEMLEAGEQCRDLRAAPAVGIVRIVRGR